MKRNGLFDANRRQSNSTGELSANTEQGKSFSLSKVLTFVGNCTCVWSGCDAESDMSIHNLSQDVAYLFGCDYSHARTMLCFRDDTGCDYGSDWDLFK